MKEGTFYTDSGPSCPVNRCARPGYGCWKYIVRQHDGEKVIAVKATCYICQADTFFQAEVDTANLNELTPPEASAAHRERAVPILEGRWQTWAYKHLLWPVWFCLFCNESVAHHDWQQGNDHVRQCQKCGVRWIRYGQPCGMMPIPQGQPLE